MLQAIFYREQKTYKEWVPCSEGNCKSKDSVFLLMRNTALTKLTKNKDQLRLHGQQQKSPNNSVIGYLTEINQLLL